MLLSNPAGGAGLMPAGGGGMGAMPGKGAGGAPGCTCWHAGRRAHARRSWHASSCARAFTRVCKLVCVGNLLCVHRGRNRNVHHHAPGRCSLPQCRSLCRERACWFKAFVSSLNTDLFNALGVTEEVSAPSMCNMCVLALAG